MTLNLIPRKEILNIAYCRGIVKGKRVKGKRIESWLNTEMLARLFELKEKKEIEELEGEHGYPIPKNPNKSNRCEACDLWWSKNSEEHWLEVKTIVFHRDCNNPEEKYSKRIVKDINKSNRLKPPYIFHHLEFIFTDERHDVVNWKEGIHSIYEKFKMQKEGQWVKEINKEQTLNIFLYTFKKENEEKA